MRFKSWFPTLIYEAPLLGRGAAALNRELLDECHRIRDRDAAGRRWSKHRYPGGYTSYGTLDQLHRMSSTFVCLREALDRHVRAFARQQDWDLDRRALQMTDCWANLMPRGVSHSLHLHPQAAVSGTYYVRTPAGSPGLKFEDPRLSKMMAAPARRAGSRRAAHITYPARAGRVILFESWLRHEVAANPVAAERVSISFNYHWT